MNLTLLTVGGASLPESQEDFELPAEPVFQGRLNNSEYLCNLETWFDYLDEMLRHGSDMVGLSKSHLALFPDTQPQTAVIEH